ncbi:hypothetical protein N0V90_005793 [Kalmusia sp. IMI 367209]|nr:hypothetical protein N0V90_005793 [Kalmusia sp. IMI 367209]
MKIPVKEDLVALCSVSHAFRVLTLPYLYRKIEINSRSMQERDRFCRSIAAGAASHFHYTTSLTIWDMEGNNIPRYPFFLIPSELAEQDDQYRLSFSGQRSVLKTVLKHFEVAKLRSFRFASEVFGLDSDDWNLLRKHTETLRHLHVDFSQLPYWMRPYLKTLDMKFRSDADPRSLAYILKDSPTTALERLHLEFSGDMRTVAYTRNGFDQMLSKHEISLVHLERLTVLSLRSVNLEDLNAWRVALPQVSNLKKLNLMDCPGTNAFLSHLGETCVMSSSQLEHLSAKLEEIDESQSCDLCLREFYKHCDRLQSLHISWEPYFSILDPEWTLDSLARFGHRLRSLSLHNYDCWDDDPTLPLRSLQQICRDCPNLEQFGIQIPESLIDDSDRGLLLFQELLQECFNRFSKLRIIHFRQMVHHPSMVERDLPKRTPDEISSSIQNCVNTFLSLVTLPELRYVVWGSDEAQSDFENDTKELVAQHCYIKGQAIDGMPGGKGSPIGIPITQSRMKLNDPDLDILQYDPVPWRNVRDPARFLYD